MKVESQLPYAGTREVTCGTFWYLYPQDGALPTLLQPQLLLDLFFVP